MESVNIPEAEERFLSAKQEALKLKIALERFDQDISGQWKEKYQSYLKFRLRPAMRQLIENNDLERIEKLVSKGWMTKTVLEEAIEVAASAKRIEIAAYLMRVKKEYYGFEDETFDL